MGSVLKIVILFAVCATVFADGAMTRAQNLPLSQHSANTSDEQKVDALATKSQGATSVTAAQFSDIERRLPDVKAQETTEKLSPLPAPPPLREEPELKTIVLAAVEIVGGSVFSATDLCASL